VPQTLKFQTTKSLVLVKGVRICRVISDVGWITSASTYLGSCGGSEHTHFLVWLLWPVFDTTPLLSSSFWYSIVTNRFPYLFIIFVPMFWKGACLSIQKDWWWVSLQVNWVEGRCKISAFALVRILEIFARFAHWRDIKYSILSDYGSSMSVFLFQSVWESYQITSIYCSRWFYRLS